MNANDGLRLLIDNEQWTHETVRGSARGYIAEVAEHGVPEHLAGISTPDQHAAYLWSDSLREWVEDSLYPEDGDGDGLSTFAALLRAEARRDYIAAIDWVALAASYIADVREDEAYESGAQ